MINNSQLTDDENTNDHISIPTSDSEGMVISPNPTSQPKHVSNTITKPPLIVPNIQDVAECMRLMDFNDHWIACNVPEKIVIALDRSKDEEVTPFQDTADNNYNPLSLLKKAVEMFVNLKSSINRQHEFALVLLEQNKAKWCHNFTSNVKEFLKAVNAVSECEAEDIFDLNSLFAEISKKVKVSNFNKDSTIPPPYVVRTVLLYNRSYTCPEIEFTETVQAMLQLPFFVLDVLVSHEPIDSTNNCEKIFSTLQNIDKKGYAYFFSVGRDINLLMRSMGKLIGHPLQRPIQSQANYSFD